MSTNWYPRSRDEQLHMADTWLQVFHTKASVWNIPPANVASLTTVDTNAKTILAVVKSRERTAAGCAPDLAAFIVVMIYPKVLSPRCPRIRLRGGSPWRGGGWQWGT
jgi:hypothetical protein